MAVGETPYLLRTAGGCLGIDAQVGIDGDVRRGTQTLCSRGKTIDGVVGVKINDIGILNGVNKLGIEHGGLSIACVQVLYCVVGCLQIGTGFLRGEASDHTDGGCKHLGDTCLIERHLIVGLGVLAQRVGHCHRLNHTEIVVEIKDAAVVDLALACEEGVGAGVHSHKIACRSFRREVEAPAPRPQGESLRLMAETALGLCIEELLCTYII